MTVLFFRVEDVLNFPETEAVSPSGKLGIVDRLVKELKVKLDDQPVGILLGLAGLIIISFLLSFICESMAILSLSFLFENPLILSLF